MKKINIKGVASQILQSAETSFSINGVYGKVKVTLNRFGEYNLFTPYSLTEASAKRNPSYKIAISEVTSKMLKSFETATKRYTEIYKNIVSIVPEKRYKDKLDGLAPKKYIRRIFDVCKPILEDAEQLIQKESRSREICGLNMNESKNPTEVLELMDEKWNELYEYFNTVETSIEEKTNQSYLAQYNTEKKQIEDYIYGPDSYVLKRIEEQINTITSPEDFQVQCDYTKEYSLLSLIVVFPSDHLINQLSETASLYSTGKLSVKAKTKKDVELEQSLFYSGIGFYLASLCFNVSANIHRIRLSVTRPNEGLYWVEFNRANFSRLKAYSLNPIIEIQNLPNVSKLNAAGNFVWIPITKFTTQVQQQSIMLDASYVTGADVTFVITIEDAKLLCNHINDNAELSELIKKVEPLGGNTIIVNKRYEKILKEIKSIHS